MQITLDPTRLAKVAELGLKQGAHRNFSAGMCAMEAASYIAGEPWSDHPQCVSPVIAAFMRNWNDSLNNEDRNRLISPELIAKTIGTANPALDERRSYMAVDWFIRVHTPAWLKLAGLKDQAAFIESLPEITGFAQIPSIRAPLEAVRQDAAAARAAAWAAARDAAWAAAWAAAWDAARDAARDAAWDAAGAAAGDAARDAAGDAAWAALKPTVAELQQSAVSLVERMCALEAEAA